jgi:hypothetical protein
MPEIGMPRNEFVDKVMEVQNKDGFVNPYTLDELAPELEQEIVGSGDESFVIPCAGAKGKESVGAYSYEKQNPLRMKEIFYAQRIYSTLFPYNFPHFNAVFGKTRRAKSEGREDDNLSGSIRTRIHPADDGQKIVYPFRHVRDVCKNIGLPLDIEDSEHNIMVGDDGGEYYVDTVDPGFKADRINIDGVNRYMSENGFSEQDIQAVNMSINRLKEIHEEFYR